MRVFLAIIFIFSGATYASTEVSCSDVKNYDEETLCLEQVLERSSELRKQYFRVSLNRYSHDQDIVRSILESDKFWLAYRDAQCSAIYTKWGGGYVRFRAHTGCLISMNRARTTELWQSFLTYVDSTPPVLPRPN